MAVWHIIYNKKKHAYVSGPNSLSKDKNKAYKYKSRLEAEKLCAEGDVVQRLN